jgi:hypothetical protein
LLLVAFCRVLLLRMQPLLPFPIGRCPLALQVFPRDKQRHRLHPNHRSIRVAEACALDKAAKSRCGETVAKGDRLPGHRISCTRNELLLLPARNADSMLLTAWRGLSCGRPSDDASLLHDVRIDSLQSRGRATLHGQRLVLQLQKRKH